MATSTPPNPDSTTNEARRATRWLAVSVAMFALILVSALSSFLRADENDDEQQARAPRFAFRDPASNKYGFFDSQGTVVLEPTYDSALDFDEGLARVQQSGKAGYIGLTGALKFELPPGTGSTKRLCEGRVWFQDASNRWGLCNDEGIVIVEPHYDDVSPFSGGRAAVNIGARRRRGDRFPHGGRWGYVNMQGVVKIPVEYESASPFSEGLARVSRSKGVKFIDLEGKVVIDLGSAFAGDFHEGVAAIHVNDSGAGHEQTQFINRTGKTEFIVEGYAHEFREGMASVGVGHPGIYGFVSRRGEPVIQPQFDRAHEFSEGLAAVATRTLGEKRENSSYIEDMNWGYIDKTGKYQNQPDFNEARPFRGGVAIVHIGGGRPVVRDAPLRWEGGEWWLIDTAGRKLRRMEK